MQEEVPSFHSKYGGLWIDRSDWQQEIQARGLNLQQKAQVEKFASDGYIILEGAASHELVDAFQQRIETSFRDGNSDIIYQSHRDYITKRLDHPADRMGGRVLDAFVALPQALDLFHVPALFDFLRLIFDADPLLFQSLSFDQGSQQGLHQDTAYVVVQQPLQLAACWIALEDVQPGSGELFYAPGSHRLPDWNFGGDRKHWSMDEDGQETHNLWGAHLVENAQKSAKGVECFLAKKGDILVWHADLAHGGSAITNPQLTRQSLVGHFCPQTTEPYFFSTHPHLAKVRFHKGLGYCSQHYNFAEMDAANVGGDNESVEGDDPSTMSGDVAGSVNREPPAPVPADALNWKRRLARGFRQLVGGRARGG
ncbi:phytanoyl-CoA dioxygenase family protein [Sphingobium cupriresistens]|uniref:Phytanoyl-CoA dioxygenase n=1 Tax=Sphingobium cupriresistens LL01 TaxID=1420583 RepID=A0A0J7Y3V3_9SPHN|nr:phytanoyl-CoA dioxygenase family protein [Sphingobium cupriresistens]KMS58372.1 phytanoyl-CoA dioxygenase [Sphingobium cupriresistens LL01]